MNKTILILFTLAILAILATGKAFAMEAKVVSAPLWAVYAQNATVGDDMRVKALENVFSKYNSPLAPVASSYVGLADKNGVDWRLLPAISGLESSFGQRLMPNSYNAYGWGGGHIYFDSWEHGIDKITKSLKDRYYARGADTVYEIGPIYAESPTWAARVTKFVDEIEAEYQRLQAQTLPITI